MSGASAAPSMLTYGPFAATAAFVEVFAGRRTIGPADRGAHVKTLEQTLVLVGYGLPGGAPPDVVFSAGTKSTLTRFQRDKGLPQTGTVDRATLEAIDRAAAAKQAVGARPGGKPDTVKMMQDLIAEAARGDSLAGTRIAREEIERALETLKLDDGAISASEWAAAQQAVSGEVFQKTATPEAKAFAAEFLRKHAASAGGGGDLKVRKLDPASRDAALGRSKLTAEIQAAEVKAGVPATPDTLPELAKRAFGRASLSVQPFADCQPKEIEARLARGVVGYARPAAAEVADVAARLASIAGRSGRVLAADWSRGSGEQGMYLVALSAGGTEAFVFDVSR